MAPPRLLSMGNSIDDVILQGFPQALFRQNFSFSLVLELDVGQLAAMPRPRRQRASYNVAQVLQLLQEEDDDVDVDLDSENDSFEDYDSPASESPSGRPRCTSTLPD